MFRTRRNTSVRWCLFVGSLVGLLLLSGTVAAQSVPRNDHPLRIGAAQGKNPGERLTGLISGARFYDRALTGEEIATLAKAQPDPAATAARPTFEWLPGRLSQNKVEPTAGNLEARAEGAVSSDTIDGVKAARFEGGYLEIANDPRLNPRRDFTIEVWVRTEKAPGTARIVDKITPGGSDGLLLDFLNGQVRVIAGRRILTASLDQPAGHWVHLACVIDPRGRPALFIDGQTYQSAIISDGIEYKGLAPAPLSPLTLWWRTPGLSWTEAMVIGNGRLGGMVAGGVKTEHVWLNDDTLWSGEPTEFHRPEAIQALPEVRRLLEEGKEPEAHALVNAKMLCVYNENYLPLGELTLQFPFEKAVEDYERQLDLPTGVARVSFRYGGVTYTRETFA